MAAHAQPAQRPLPLRRQHASPAQLPSNVTTQTEAVAPALQHVQPSKKPVPLRRRPASSAQLPTEPPLQRWARAVQDLRHSVEASGRCKVSHSEACSLLARKFDTGGVLASAQSPADQRLAAKTLACLLDCMVYNRTLDSQYHALRSMLAQVLSATKRFAPKDFCQDELLSASVQRLVSSVHDAKDDRTFAAASGSLRTHVLALSRAQMRFRAYCGPFWQSLDERLAHHGTDGLDVATAIEALKAHSSVGRRGHANLSEASVAKLVGFILEQAAPLSKGVAITMVFQMSAWQDDSTRQLHEHLQERLLTGVCMIARSGELDWHSQTHFMECMVQLLNKCIAPDVRAKHAPALQTALTQAVMPTLSMCCQGNLKVLRALGGLTPSESEREHFPPKLLTAMKESIEREKATVQHTVAVAQIFAELSTGRAVSVWEEWRVGDALLRRTSNHSIGSQDALRMLRFVGNDLLSTEGAARQACALVETKLKHMTLQKLETVVELCEAQPFDACTALAAAARDAIALHGTPQHAARTLLPNSGDRITQNVNVYAKTQRGHARQAVRRALEGVDSLLQREAVAALFAAMHLRMQLPFEQVRWQRDVLSAKAASMCVLALHVVPHKHMSCSVVHVCGAVCQFHFLTALAVCRWSSC